MTPQEKLRRDNAWLEAHPLWSWAIALWFALAVLVSAMALRFGLDAFVRWVTR